jgi:hypothetical protein
VLIALAIAALEQPMSAMTVGVGTPRIKHRGGSVTSIMQPRVPKASSSQ